MVFWRSGVLAFWRFAFFLLCSGSVLLGLFFLGFWVSGVLAFWSFGLWVLWVSFVPPVHLYLSPPLFHSAHPPSSLRL